jgi:hypothetical protein
LGSRLWFGFAVEVVEVLPGVCALFFVDGASHCFSDLALDVSFIVLEVKHFCRQLIFELG